MNHLHGLPISYDVCEALSEEKQLAFKEFKQAIQESTPFSAGVFVLTLRLTLPPLHSTG